MSQYRHGNRYQWDEGYNTPVSPLVPDILAYWQLNEAAGTRADVTGLHPLTDNNTVTQAAGRVDFASLHVALNQEYLNSTHDFNLPVGTDWTIQGWCFPTALAGGATYGRGVIAFQQGATVQGSWMIGVQANGRISCYHFKQVLVADPDGRHDTVATGLVADGAWTHIVFRCQSGVYTIWANGVSQAFTDATTDTGWGSGMLQVGRLYDAFDSTYHWNGRLDEIGLWGRALTNAEIAQLYNGGAGITYPF